VVLLFFAISVVLGPSLYVAWRSNQAEQAGMPLSDFDRSFVKMMEQLDYTALMGKPSIQHPFGTDELGRDLLARALYGGRVSLSVGVVAMLIAITLGTFIGAMAGFFGGRVDQVLMRLTDLFL